MRLRECPLFEPCTQRISSPSRAPAPPPAPLQKGRATLSGMSEAALLIRNGRRKKVQVSHISPPPQARSATLVRYLLRGAVAVKGRDTPLIVFEALGPRSTEPPPPLAAKDPTAATSAAAEPPPPGTGRGGESVQLSQPPAHVQMLAKVLPPPTL